MLLTRLYLRNFRVYEDELDLELPPGLVGIYGANGAGKSTLLEAIIWTLWGKARTTKEQIRSSGVGGDCITEVEFEHEGHLYLVRRTLSGHQRHSPPRGLLRRAAHVAGGPRRRAVHRVGPRAWTTAPSGRRCSPSRSSWPPSPATPLPNGCAWCCASSASPRSTPPGTWPAGTPAGRPAITPGCEGCCPTSTACGSRRPTWSPGRRRPPSRPRPSSRLPRTAQERRSSRRHRPGGPRPAPPGARCPGHRRTGRSGRTGRSQPGGHRAAGGAGRPPHFGGPAVRHRRRGRRRRRRRTRAGGPRGGGGRGGRGPNRWWCRPSHRPSTKPWSTPPGRRRPKPVERLAGLVSLVKAAEEDVGRARQVADRAASLGDEADCPLCGQALGAAFRAGPGPSGRRAQRRRGPTGAALAPGGGGPPAGHDHGRPPAQRGRGGRGSPTGPERLGRRRSPPPGARRGPPRRVGRRTERRTLAGPVVGGAATGVRAGGGSGRSPRHRAPPARRRPGSRTPPRPPRAPPGARGVARHQPRTSGPRRRAGYRRFERRSATSVSTPKPSSGQPPPTRRPAPQPRPPRRAPTRPKSRPPGSGPSRKQLRPGSPTPSSSTPSWRSSSPKPATWLGPPICWPNSATPSWLRSGPDWRCMRRSCSPS